ncbi:MAG: Gldg family protein [Melioribacteraceae bacterium]|nr:Gldg family protein [Melioribacteraceae bacterium]
MLTRKKLQTTVLLIVGILVLVNIIADKLFFRLDFTADQRYSLSRATTDILNELNDPVTVTAYFSEDLPPDVAKVKTDFKDMLIEYSNNSGGQIVYEFINPNEDQETEMQAQQNGIQPIMINVRERDQVKQQRAYLGAVLQLGEKKEIIPFIQPGAAMEFALSSNIKKLSVQQKQKVGFLQGHGEPSLSSMQQVDQALSVMYNTDTVTVTPVRGVPGDINTLVVIAPKDTVNGYVFDHLDNFIARGGRILLALNRVEGDLSASSGKTIYTGFEDWVKEKGIEIEDNFLIDINCSNVMVRQQQGMFVMNTPISFPYLPIISNFADHPITEGLEAVVLPFASGIKINPIDTSLAFMPLALSSEKSGTKNTPLYFDISKQWRPSDFPLSSIPVGVAVEGRISGDVFNKMVVFGDGDFAVNGEGQQAQQLQPDNISLLVNAIDWLSDDTGLIELRTKGVTSRPIDADLEDGTKTLLKYVNFLLPIILIVAYGIFRFQVNRNIRNKLKSIDYVK